jgi:chitinase
VLNNDPIFSAPYNYPQQDYKTDPAAPYPTNVDDVPFQKRDLLEAVMMGNVSDPFGDELVEPVAETIESGNEAAESGLEDPNDIDCNACDIIVDDEDVATYVNPAYSQASSEANWPEPPVTSTIIFVETVTTTLPPSHAGFRVETREPLETGRPQDGAR